MKIKHLSILSATAVALLSLSGAAQAGDRGDRGDHGDHGGLCSNATLKGPYEFIGHGEILGLKAADGTLHPYAAPSILDDVALVTFDGSGRLFTHRLRHDRRVAERGADDIQSEPEGHLHGELRLHRHHENRLYRRRSRAGRRRN